MNVLLLASCAIIAPTTPVPLVVAILFLTVTQISMGLGIALGAIAIRAARLFGPSSLVAADHRLAFLLVAMVGVFGVLDSLLLAKNAGDLVARRKRK